MTTLKLATSVGGTDLPQRGLPLPGSLLDHLQRLRRFRAGQAAGHAGAVEQEPTLGLAPSSADERISTVCASTSGFVYAASTMGVTGARTTLSSAAGELVARTRTATELPICVGVGVSTSEQAATVAQYADGVIVGSAFVRRVLDAPDQAAAVAAVRELASDLARGVRR